MTPTIATTQLRFRPSQKLRRGAEFDRVRKGKRNGDTVFAVHQVPNELGHARLGMAVSARAIRSAVRRNRIRRVIRETFRMHQHELPAIDLFVTVRAPAAQCGNAELVQHLLRLWRLSPLP